MFKKISKRECLSFYQVLAVSFICKNMDSCLTALFFFLPRPAPSTVPQFPPPGVAALFQCLFLLFEKEKNVLRKKKFKCSYYIEENNW